MWDKLLALFKNTQQVEEVQSVAPIVSEQSNPVQVSSEPVGKSTHIGYNYLKGLNSEDSTRDIRRFINLNKLLRGSYNGKIETSHAEPKSDIRGEDSE